MINLFYFYVTGQMTDLEMVPEHKFIEFNSPYHKKIDLHTYGFIFRIQYTTLSKLQVLKIFVIEAFFMNNDEKSFFLNRFSKIQRCYWAFSRLARSFKVKKAKQFDIDCDLCTTPFTALPKSVLTDIYDDETQTMYRFRLSDIVTLANRALSHSPNFFVQPFVVRNPYTNIPFTKAQLYQIYFELRESPLMMPSLFHLWFTVNFNLKVFLREYEPILVNKSIRDLVQNGSNEDIIGHIYDMAQYYLVDHTIADNYPAERLIHYLKPYLEYYLLSQYSLSPTLRKRAEISLRSQIYEFKMKNPLFNRIIYRITSI